MQPVSKPKSRITNAMRRLLTYMAIGSILVYCGCAAENEYVLVDGTWRFKHKHGWEDTDLTRLPNVDAASFTSINDVFARDLNTVFFRGRTLNGANPSTFRIVTKRNGTYYSTDSNAVFCDEFRLSGSDPSTFHFVEEYAVDSGQVYRGCKLMPMADARSFHKHGRYWVDLNHVFRLYEPVVDLDPNALVQDSGGVWAHDDKLICVGTTCIRPDDIASFRVIQGTYARDKFSFYAASSGLTPRKIRVADQDSFEVVDGMWAKDQTTVYWTGTPLSGAKPQTFKILRDAAGVDGNNCYSFGVKSEPQRCR